MKNPLKICKNCKFYNQTGFTIDQTQPTHWQQVRRHGECGFIKIVFGESMNSYTSDYNTCHEWQEKEDISLLK